MLVLHVTRFEAMASVAVRTLGVARNVGNLTHSLSSRWRLGRFINASRGLQLTRLQELLWRALQPSTRARLGNSPGLSRVLQDVIRGSRRLGRGLHRVRVFLSTLAH